MNKVQKEQKENFEKVLKRMDNDMKPQHGDFHELKDCTKTLQHDIEQLHKDVLQANAEQQEERNSVQRNLTQVTGILTR